MGEFLEPLGEVEGGIKTEEGGDFADRKIRFAEEPFYAFKAKLGVVLFRAESGVLLEHAAKIGVSNI